jgi:hypothetical protein
MSISTTIKSIQDIMRKDVGVDGDAQRIGQLVWMLFLKIFDDRETEWELLDDTYRSPVPSSCAGATGPRPRGHHRRRAARLRQQQAVPHPQEPDPAQGDQRGFVIRSVFEDAYNYMKSGQLMRQVINKIKPASTSTRRRTATSSATSTSKSCATCKAPATPASTTPPAPSPSSWSTWSTPSWANHARPGLRHRRLSHLHHRTRAQAVRQDARDEQRLQASIHGVEKKPLPHLLCTSPTCCCTASTCPATSATTTPWRAPCGTTAPATASTSSLTNPPFGGMEEDGIEPTSPDFRTRETADLFLVLIIAPAQDGGRAAVVLPDGTLFGEGIKTRIKEQLLTTCNLHTIVRLPNGVFAPTPASRPTCCSSPRARPPGRLVLRAPLPARRTRTTTRPSPCASRSSSRKRPGGGLERTGWRTNTPGKVSPTTSRRATTTSTSRTHTARMPKYTTPTTAGRLRRLATADRPDPRPTQGRACCRAGGQGVSVMLSEHLPLLASAPNGIQKLRSLILELAVRGKLVPQDPKDEPASEVLKRIAKERARLEADGKIKKSKPLPPVSHEDQPFALPNGWEWVRLSEISRDWGQKTPNEDFSYIDVSAIDNTRGKIVSPSVVTPNDAPSRARKMVRRGTVIYSTVRPYLLNIAVVDRELSPPPIASTAFAVVHPLSGISSQYIFWYLRSPVFVRYVESVQTGIAYPAVNDSQFFSGFFSLAPLAEQHRIVAKVDELMTLCDQLEAEVDAGETAHAKLVEALLDTLTQSADAAELAANWQRLAKHFDTLFTTESSLDALKQTILQLAVMGKLVRKTRRTNRRANCLSRLRRNGHGWRRKELARNQRQCRPSVRMSSRLFYRLDGFGDASMKSFTQVSQSATAS